VVFLRAMTAALVIYSCTSGIFRVGQFITSFTGMLWLKSYAYYDVDVLFGDLAFYFVEIEEYDFVVLFATFFSLGEWCF